MKYDAQASVRNRLAKIAQANGGRLTPEQVVEDAKDPKSPLHAYFTWDLQTAAQQCWLDQARTLIRSVRVEMTTQTTTISSVAYVRDPAAGDGQQGYVAVTKLRDDKEMARDALVEEFARVAAMLRRARELAVALDAVSDVEALLNNVVGLRQRFINAAPEVRQ